jgi:hypothetical protein
MNKLVCYIPGLDLRRVGPDQTPYLAELLASHPWAAVQTVPSPEHLSTIVTGMHPHRHRIWQTRLREESGRSLSKRMIDTLPDFVTTTAQAVIHQLFGCCDVPTIPPRRRRAFDFRRLKFRGRADTEDLLAQLNGVQSIVDVLGTERCRYRFSDRLEDTATLVDEACEEAGVDLEFVQFHALDMLGHWQIKTPEAFRQYYGLVDRFIRDLHCKCEAKRFGMVLMTDHGQEKIETSIDLARLIRRLDVPRSEFAYFLQPIMARFWCHSERARAAIYQMLGEVKQGTTMSYADMHSLGVEFTGPEFGEIYFIADPGSLFFPHDFHHPLVNSVFGLMDWQQRNRLTDPRHVAYHGYLPRHECEKGFMAVLDDSYEPDSKLISLVDIAPSVLGLMGRELPDWMDGTARFSTRRH